MNKNLTKLITSIRSQEQIPSVEGIGTQHNNIFNIICETFLKHHPKALEVTVSQGRKYYDYHHTSLPQKVRQWLGLSFNQIIQLQVLMTRQLPLVEVANILENDLKEVPSC
jgi:phage/plasmid-associated DNA primase